MAQNAAHFERAPNISGAMHRGALAGYRSHT
jgi:hypothetical protein